MGISLALLLVNFTAAYGAALLEQQVAFEGDEVNIRGLRAAQFSGGVSVSFAPQDENTDPTPLSHRIFKRGAKKVLAAQLPLIPTDSLTGSLVVKGSGNEVLARLPMVIYQTPVGVDPHGGDDLPEVPDTVDAGLVDTATILASLLTTFVSQTGAVADGDSIKVALQKLQGTKIAKGDFNYEKVASTVTDIGALANEELSVANGNIMMITSSGANSTIAKLTAGIAGQTVTLVFKSGISIRDKVGGGVNDSINIAGTGVQVFNSGDVLRLLYVDSKWVELGRSTN